jgi:GTP-binding protein HflX
VLGELEADKKPRLHVLNKMDLVAPADREGMRDDARTVHISALRGFGLTSLLERIDQMLELDPVRRVHLRIPQSEGKALALLEAGARVDSRHYRDGAVDMEVQAPESVVRKVARFVVD